MESAKLAIFVTVFVAFFIVARRLFSGGSDRYSSDYPQPYPDALREPSAIGSELPFPVKLPAVEQLPNGRYNRPKVLNYYFSNLDLKVGPDNPRSFCDQLFVEFEAPETGARWTNEYTVATPFGLQDLLDQMGQNLCFDGTLLIVPRWDIAQILKTALDDVMEKYASSEPSDVKSEDPSSRYF